MNASPGERIHQTYRTAALAAGFGDDIEAFKTWAYLEACRNVTGLLARRSLQGETEVANGICQGLDRRVGARHLCLVCGCAGCCGEVRCGGTAHNDSPSLGVTEDLSVGEGPVGEAAARPADRVLPPDRPPHDGGPYPFMLHRTDRTPWLLDFYTDPQPPAQAVPFIDTVADGNALLDALRQVYDLGKTHGAKERP